MEHHLAETCRVVGAPDTIHYFPDFISQEEEQQLLHHVYAAPKPRWTQLAHRRLQNWGGLPHPKGMVPEPLPPWLKPVMDKVTSLGCFGENKKQQPNHVLVNEYLPGQGIMPHTDGPLFTPVITTVTLGSHALLNLYSPRCDDTSAADSGPVGDGGGAGIPRNELSGDGCAQAPDSKPPYTNITVQPTDTRSPSNDDEVSTVDRGGGGRLLGSVLLERRSLVVVRGEAYSDTLHGIGEVAEDTITAGVFNPGARGAGEVMKRETRVSVTIRHVPKVLKLRLRL